jgi:hypothetical protein
MDRRIDALALEKDQQYAITIGPDQWLTDYPIALAG